MDSKPGAMGRGSPGSLQCPVSLNACPKELATHQHRSKSQGVTLRFRALTSRGGAENWVSTSWLMELLSFSASIGSHNSMHCLQEAGR